MAIVEAQQIATAPAVDLVGLASQRQLVWLKFTEHKLAVVSLVVIAELTWLLRRTYDYPHQAILEAVMALLDSADFVVEARDVVLAAIDIAANHRFGLADVLIAQIALRAGCAATVTFDKTAAKRIPGMELLA